MNSQDLEILLEEIVEARQAIHAQDNSHGKLSVYAWAENNSLLSAGYLNEEGIEEFWIEAKTKGYAEKFAYLRADTGVFFYGASSPELFVPTFLMEPEHEFEADVMDFFKRGRLAGRYVLESTPGVNELFDRSGFARNRPRTDEVELVALLPLDGLLLLPGIMRSDKDLNKLAYHFLDLFTMSQEP